MHHCTKNEESSECTNTLKLLSDHQTGYPSGVSFLFHAFCEGNHGPKLFWFPLQASELTSLHSHACILGIYVQYKDSDPAITLWCIKRKLLKLDKSFTSNCDLKVRISRNWLSTARIPKSKQEMISASDRKEIRGQLWSITTPNIAQFYSCHVMSELITTALPLTVELSNAWTKAYRHQKPLSTVH